MRLGCVGADVHRDLAVLHVVVRIGHRTVAPSIGNTSHCGGVTNTRLVVAIVRAKVAHKFAQQIGLFVVVLGRTDPIHAVGSTGFAQVEQLGCYFVQRRVPTDAFVLAVDQLHGIAQTELAVAVFAQGCALGAMRA